MGNLLKAIWKSKAGKMAIFGGGGLIAAGSVYLETLPADAPQVEGAGMAMIGLLTAIAAVGGPKLVAAIGARFGGGKKDGASS